MEPVIIDSSRLQIVCISDTHNDDCSKHITPADILIHTGDLTDDGTLEECQAAFSWISALPHKVKVVVAGNHDVALDRTHHKYLQDISDLFTSIKAKDCGIVYLDREVKTVAYARASPGDIPSPIRIYGNPCQPEFFKPPYPYAFTYLAAPSEAADNAWITAPSRGDGINIWAMHSPPKDRLDFVPVPPLTGCVVQAQKIAEARPLLCVFGHYHCSWGIERVRWRANTNEVETAHKLQYEDRQTFDFTAAGVDGAIEKGKETIFVNAAWMTMEKRKVERRNPPFLITLPLPL